MLKSNIDVFFVTSFLCSLKFLFFHLIEIIQRGVYEKKNKKIKIKIKKIKNKKKMYLGFIIIYFGDGFLILLFTYVNLYLLVLLFILSFIVSYGG